ncbi:MAG TPA: XRE family transcriptional regulator [Cyclobacteriaceae bacterium]|nr:XRE family transcriptional regulator [Cyclobacteriaceae bacterium]MCB0500508.1 XRE family transcriptional regulator [Cyclobacteriaceae bacterium]MCB9238469.1 XRE family transcriptional regulator [Flammeovirgaceae bacterium]MCW5903595.1 XRE family transcriptional regulator [Cyclobacteriaceae bacterium]HOO08400.1 XRE family transcriptional regulator [Cyclobacteriaceae bacterium]
MTELGVYLAKKSASNAEIAKKTGISKSRMSELTLNLYPTKDADRSKVLVEVCKDLKPGYKKLKY